MKSVLHSPTETRWREPGFASLNGLSASLRSWVLEDGSLTQRLKEACQGDFFVEVINQRYQRPLASERLILKMNDRDAALVRQVRLLCAGQPWVFARTVIPVRSLKGGCRRLTRLGSRPLGAMLFANRTVQRGKMEIAQIRRGQKFFEMAMMDLDNEPSLQADVIWGRRSIFHFADSPLLVSEIFLPDHGLSTDQEMPLEPKPMVEQPVYGT